MNSARCAAHTRQIKPDDWRMWLTYVSTGSSAKSCSNQIWISYGCQLNGTNEVQLRKATRCQTEQTYAVDFQVRAQIEKTITLNGKHQSECEHGDNRRRKWWKYKVRNQKETLRKFRPNDIEFLFTRCNLKREHIYIYIYSVAHAFFGRIDHHRRGVLVWSTTAWVLLLARRETEADSHRWHISLQQNSNNRLRSHDSCTHGGFSFIVFPWSE